MNIILIMRYLILILSLLLLNLQAIALDVVYPKYEKVTINCRTTFFVGSADPNLPLTINGIKVPVHKSGGFAHFVKLDSGNNVFTLKSGDEVLEYKVHSTHKITNPSAVNANSEATSSLKAWQKIKGYENSKLVYTIHDKTPVRTTPVSSGINRVVHLQEGVPLYIDGEYGKFYRLNFCDNEKYWIEKSDVRLEKEITINNSMIVSRSFKDTGKYLVYTFDITGKTPYIIKENSDKDFENGLGLNFYNTITKPNSPYELYFPLQHELFGYNGEFKDGKFILTIRKIPKISVQKPLKNLVIAVDAGHGGYEKGAIGCLGDSEKDINLDVALKLQKVLLSRGAKVIMTRESDVQVPLKKRVEITNENDASIFISIHGNALPDSKNPLEHRGTSVYYYYPQAKALANSILKSMNNVAHTINDGVRQGSFAVVRNTNAISVLVEMAYLINPEDNAMLIDDKFRSTCATAIADGIENYVRTLGKM